MADAENHINKGFYERQGACVLAELPTTEEMDAYGELRSGFVLVIGEKTCIITTGAGVTVPTVFFAKKLLGTKVVFVNSAADVTHASKTPVWIEKYADLFLVQWEDMKAIFPHAKCCGVL